MSFGDCNAFEEYIKIAHNSRFATVSRQTTNRDLVKYYTDHRNNIIETLAAASSVDLTSEIWSGNAKKTILVWLFILLELIGN